MRHVKIRLALMGAGAILVLIGGALMLDPKTFLEMSQVLVERDPGLMSELSAPSGVFLAAGALMLTGAVRLRFANLALLVGAIVYGSIGFGRVVAMLLHGTPPEALISATVIEFAIAALLSALGLTTRLDPRAEVPQTHALQVNL